MFDLAKFTLSDSIDLGCALRKLGKSASSIEKAAQEIVLFLQMNLIDGLSNEPGCVLTRLFKTHRFSLLDSAVQEQVRATRSDLPPSTDFRCLTLLATAGIQEQWNDPAQSSGHRIIPLINAEAVQGAPMLARLFSQFGVGVESLVDPSTRLFLNQDEQAYKIFYVPIALDSPFIPAQHEFVEPFGVRSVIGFGAPLPSGELFAIILFSKVSVLPESAELFRPMALNIKLALLPFDSPNTKGGGQIHPGSLPSAKIQTPVPQNHGMSVAYGDTLMQLLCVQEEVAKEATHTLEDRNGELACARDSALKASDDKSRILSAVDAFFICVSDRGLVMDWTPSAEKMFRVSRTKAIGQAFRSLPIGWDWKQVLEAFDQAGKTMADVQVDGVQLSAPNDKGIFLTMTVSPRIDESGTVLIVMGKNITARLVMERELAQAQKLESIGQLAAGIAHEINTPTQFVGDNVSFLSQAFADIGRVLAQYQGLLAAAKTGVCPEALIETCEAANRGADLEYLLAEIPKALEQSAEGIDRVATLVRAMKEFSHPGNKEKTAVNLNKAIESTVIVARNEWKYVADLQTHLDPLLPPVPCLVGEFNQVVLNMIINASHAIAGAGKDTGGKGTITISTSHVGDCAEVRIADTGMGIPESLRHKIFDPFFTTKGVGKGTGQGLAIARSVVVDKHGGTITVDSEVGKGTTFVIRLPLTPSVPAVEAGCV